MPELKLTLLPVATSGWLDLVQVWLWCYLGLLAIYFVVCGLLHRANTRHPERRIQTRPMKQQIAMEVRQSVKSLATIALYLAGGLFVQAKGWALTPWALTWTSGIAFYVISIVIYDAWFYWGHRLMHVEPLYTRWHSHHHRSIVPTPWSNNSDTLVGAFVEQSFFFFVVFFLPIPPAILILAKVHDQITGIIGHAGHEYFASASARRPWPLLCTVFHDQHHGYFRYNYANAFSFWDRLMGTLHPTYDATVERFEGRGTPLPPAR